MLLSGCAGDKALMRGIVYHDTVRLSNTKVFEQQIKLEDKEFYRFTLYFR